MTHRTQVWIWKLHRDREPSCYNWPKWIIILYYTRSLGKLEVNFEISILEMSDLWLLKISLEEHTRHHNLTSELIMKFQFSISIIIILLTSYLRDLYILWTIYRCLLQESIPSQEQWCAWYSKHEICKSCPLSKWDHWICITSLHK